MNNISVASSSLEFNPNLAQYFLSKFNYEITTLQLLAKNQQKTSLPAIPGKVLWNNTKGSSSVCYRSSHDFNELNPFTSQPFLQDIFLHQNQDLGVFFMVNEGDGITHPPAQTARSHASVKLLKALFIDTDNGDIKTIGNYLLKTNLLPHFVIQSSPGKFHIYLLIDDLPISKPNVDRWKSIQEHFFNLDPKYDQSMADTAKLLRLPGFYHTKTTPQLVTVVQDNSNHIKYSLDDIYGLLPISVQVTSDLHLNGNNHNSYIVPSSKVLEGSRHQELISYVRHQSNSTLNRSDLISAALGHTLRFFDQPADFLPGGQRYSELEKIIDDVLSYAKQEQLQLLDQHDQKQNDHSISNNDNTPESQNSKTSLSPEEIFDKFALPDQFYFDAPGIVGEITKFISQSAFYSAAPFAFATTAAAIGTLKSHIVKTESGNSPANYFLCFGPTGSGKNYPQEIFAQTFKALGTSSLISNKIRSENGIYRFLEENKGIGFLLMDEAETFFSLIQNQKSDGYIKQCKDALLHLYSGTNKTFHSGHTGNKREKPIILENPKLNLVAYGVPSMLVNSFDKAAISDGLLQRFIILTHRTKREKNPSFLPPASLNSHFKDWMKDIVLRAKLSTEADLLEMLELEQELDAATAAPDADAELDKVKKDLKLKLKKLKDTKPEVDKVILRFSSGAKSCYDSFETEINKATNVEIAKFSGLEGIYSRAVEQVDRLVAVLATAELGQLVPETTVEYTVQFIRSRVNAIKEFCETTYEDTSAPKAKGVYMSEDMDALLKFCSKFLKTSPYITYREIFRSFKVRDARRLQEILQGCLALGELIEVSKDELGISKRGFSGRYFKLK